MISEKEVGFLQLISSNSSGPLFLNYTCPRYHCIPQSVLTVEHVSEISVLLLFYFSKF